MSQNSNSTLIQSKDPKNLAADERPKNSEDTEMEGQSQQKTPADKAVPFSIKPFLVALVVMVAVGLLLTIVSNGMHINALDERSKHLTELEKMRAAVEAQKISELQSVVTALDKKVTDLQPTLQKTDAALATLDASIQKLDFSQLQTAVSQTQTAVQEVQTSNGALKTQIDKNLEATQKLSTDMGILDKVFPDS
jgi:vacuolar-type H+-ATPase subunit I/STV1